MGFFYSRHLARQNEPPVVCCQVLIMRKFPKLLEKNELLAAARQLEWSDIVVCEDRDHFGERIS
jgi:hypothetical protein